MSSKSRKKTNVIKTGGSETLILIQKTDPKDIDRITNEIVNYSSQKEEAKRDVKKIANFLRIISNNLNS